MAMKTLDLKLEMLKMAERLQKWQLALDRAVVAIDKIHPEAKAFYVVSLDQVTEDYVGMVCKTCEGMHDTEIGLEGQLKSEKRLRHREGCPVAKLEEVLARQEVGR